MKTQQIIYHHQNLPKNTLKNFIDLLEGLHDVKWQKLKKTHKIREAAIDFIVQLNEKLTFKKDTLFLAIKMLDILIKQSFKPFCRNYQLTAAAIVILSTKYNEVHPVTFEQINLVTSQYYPCASIIKIEGLILECLNFQIPNFTIYSELYNKLKDNFKYHVETTHDKQNQQKRNNQAIQINENQKKYQQNYLFSYTLRTIKVLQCLKYGEQFLKNGIISYISNQKCKGNSINSLKNDHIKAIVKKTLEPSKLQQNMTHRKNIFHISIKIKS